MTSIGLTRIAEMLSFRPVLVNTLAALAVLAALVLDGVLWSVLPALATLLLIGWGKRRTLVRPRGRVGGLGRSLPARYLLLAAALVQLHGIDQLGGVAIATGVLSVLALGMEKVLRASSRFAVPYAAHVPGHRPRSAPSFRYGIALPLSMLSVLMLVLAPLAPEPLLLIALLLAAAALAALLLAQLDVARRIQDRRRFQAELPRILETIGPVFYLYWHAPRRSAFQVTMWLPHLERLGVPFMLVTRTASAFRQLQEATDHPVILRRSLTDLDDLIVPSVRGVFYVNNAMRNNHMVRYSQLTHIQLLHGESDKASSASPVTRMYDLNFVAGQAAIDRFERCGVPMPPGIFRITGRPQVEGIDAGRAAIEEIGTPSVLYAPTWLGNQAETNYSSLPAGPTIVRGLLERGCTVVFRPHPYSADSPSLRAACEEIRDVLAADAAATGRAHLFGTVAEREMSVVDCFNAADAMIADVSGVVGDFLHSGKPLAMVSPRTGAAEFVLRFPMARAAYVLEVEGSVPRDLDGVLDELLRTDSRREERRRWATYYLGDIPREGYAERFVTVAREELGLGGAVPAAPDPDSAATS